MPKYGYLPEWKICFWKKIILDKEWITSHRHSLQSLQAFPDADLRSEIIKSQDAIIDEIHSKIPVVLSSKSARDYLKTQIVSPGRTKDAWFYFLIENARDSLFELSYLIPPALEIIDILLDRICIDEYRQRRKEFERIELNKSVGIMGNNGDSPAAVTKTIAWKLYLTDPHCELGNIVYKKTLRGEFLTQDETHILLKNNSRLPITFGLKINDVMLKQKVDEYIDNFIQQDLMPEKDALYFSVDQQRHNLLDTIQRIVPSYGYKNIFLSLERVMKINGWDRSTAEQHRFFEGMFSLERTGEIKIDNLRGSGDVVFSLTEAGLKCIFNDQRQTSQHIVEQIEKPILETVVTATHDYPKSKIQLIDKQLRWRQLSVPMDRGHGRVIEILLKNAKKMDGNGKSQKNGELTNRKILQNVGGYRDEHAFRNALKLIRGKIKNFPMRITNPTTNNYLLEIDYRT